MSGLPEDILLRILSFLSPPDIIRLRQVSKTLYSATQQPVVWIRAYKNAALPRPPGPYLRAGDKEGLDFVERALVQSAKLEPWSAREFHLDPVRTHRIDVGEYYMSHQWHFPQWGSWFITAIESSVVYRNLNSDDPQPHVLFRLDASSEGINLVLFADTVTLTGHPITYVLLEAQRSDYPLTLLKIVGHFRSSLALEAAIPLSYPGHNKVSHMIASPRHVCMYTNFVDGEFTFALLDVTTEKIYHLPAVKSSVAPEILERLARNGRTPVAFLVTDTHILVFITGVVDAGHHIQAFRLPLEVESGATAEDDGMLQMTHKEICKITESPEFVLRGNKVTNVGGVQTTEIRVMIRRDQSYGSTSSQRHYSAIDLTLTASSSPGIGTITLSQSTPLISLKDRYPELFKVESSEDGFGRGVCCIGGVTLKYFGIQTFSVDASGPVCRVDLGPRRDLTTLFPLWSRMEFDAWSGKVCYMSDETIRVHKFV